MEPRPPPEKLLVCLSSSPHAEKIVHAGRRLADELNAGWVAVYVEVASEPELNPANRARIDEMLRLAESLGATARKIAGHSICEAVFAYARQHNITKMVVGKPLRPRWREWLSGSVVDQLVHAGADIDIYVISARAEVARPVVPEDWRPHRPLLRYALSLGLVVLATLIGLVFRGRIESTNLVMFYLVSVVLAALYLGRGPSLLAAIAGVLAFYVIMIPPYYTLEVDNTEYIFTLVVLLAISLVVSTLTARVREQAEAAIEGEVRATGLYSLGRDLTSARDLGEVGSTIIAHISEVFGRQAAIFLPEGGRLVAFAHSPDHIPDDTELAVAQWVLEHDQPAGHGTETLPDASIRCHPLRAARGLVGVLGVRRAESGSFLTLEERQSLLAFADQAALSIERAALAEQAKQAELLSAADKLQTALLNSISHDLRTPLVSITGALSALEQEDQRLDDPAQRSLVHTARGEADRLNRLVGNLLDMTRIEAGALRIKREPCDVEDLIGAAIGQMEERLAARAVRVDVGPGSPPISADFVLIVHVLSNLLDNALKYSADDSPLEVRARPAGKEVQITVMDRGIGIPKDDLEQIFDKFYRVQRPEQVTGTGLGLAICKGIAEAHGGRIWVEARAGGGTCVTLAIPAAEER